MKYILAIVAALTLCSCEADLAREDARLEQQKLIAAKARLERLQIEMQINSLTNRPASIERP